MHTAPKAGSFITTLRKIIKEDLPGLLHDTETMWKTLHVTYEEPHVERVWIQLGENRLNLHRIHPCKKPLIHPHPWPSAVVIYSGTYQMGVGKYGQNASDELATMHLTEGSSYEMLHRHAWHYVMPLEKPSMSIMLTGTPWPPDGLVTHPGKQQSEPLDPKAKREILEFFRARVL